MRLIETTRRFGMAAVTPGYALTVLLFFGALLLTLWLPLKPCLLYQTTGLPCFLCGGTRASLALVSGDWMGALRWNPLAVIALVSVVGWAVMKFGFARRVELGLSRRTLWVVGIGAVLANWGYVLATQGIG